MRLGGFQKTTLVDYPGRVASIVFTMGCNMRCSYCYNSPLVLNTATEIPLDSVMSQLLARKKWVRDVVITGGEPTIWKDLPGFIRSLKKEGFSVKLDTNGFNPRMIEEILEEKLVDYVAMDVKAPWVKYEKVTFASFPVENVKETLSLLREGGTDYEFRTTVFPGMTLTDLEEIARQIAPARRWLLQLFIASETVLDKKILSFQMLREEEILSLIKKHEPDFEECGLRNSG